MLSCARLEPIVMVRNDLLSHTIDLYVLYRLV